MGHKVASGGAFTDGHQRDAGGNWLTQRVDGTWRVATNPEEDALIANSGGQSFQGGQSVGGITLNLGGDPVGFDTAGEAAIAAFRSGVPINNLELFVKDNLWNFSLKEDTPPDVESWSTGTDPNTGEFFRINSRTGERVKISTPGAPLTQSFAVPGTNQQAVRLPDGNWRLVDRPEPSQIPGELSTTPIPGTNHILVTEPDGSTRVVPAASDPSTGEIRPQEIELDGQMFAYNPATGSFSQIQHPDPTFDQGFIDEERGLFQQRSGQVTQFAPRDLEDIITQALIDGETEKAFAYQDFLDRPTAAESLDFALRMARSPADQQIISEIARGAATVNQQPFDPNRPQRVGPQPDFLIREFQDFQRRRFAGELPSDTEANEFRQRLLEGASPESDRLKAEIRILEEKALTEKQKREDAAAAAEAQRAAIAMNAEGAAAKLKQDLELARKKAFAAAEVRSEALSREETDNLRFNPTGEGNPGDVQRFVEAEQQLRDLGFNIPNPIADIPNVEEGFASLFDTTTPASTPVASAPSTSFLNPATGESFNTFQELETDLTNQSTAGQDAITSGTAENALAFLAQGGTAKGSNLEVVGEDGPELVDLAPGSRVIPIKQLSMAEVKKLKKKGVRGMQSGGIVFEGTQNLPFGLRQLQSGRSITPPRGNLLRAANLRLPSQQALQNLTPESVEVFRDQAALAGIPPGALEQEFALTRPGGQRLPQGRFRPLNLSGVR
jgi:hypothetical protein